MRPRRRRGGAGGGTTAEILVVLALVGMLLAGVVPAARQEIARVEAEAAARGLVSEIRLLRERAVASGVGRGLAFQRTDRGWSVSVLEDGDGDGIRADDIRREVDRVTDGPQGFAERYGAAWPGFHPSLERLSSPPPVSQPLGVLQDPFRFGTTDVITMSPRGTLSSGTIYLTDGVERQMAVVVYGATARLRVWQYDLGLKRWALQ